MLKMLKGEFDFFLIKWRIRFNIFKFFFPPFKSFSNQVYKVGRSAEQRAH